MPTDNAVAKLPPLEWEPSTHHQVPQPAGRLCAAWYEAYVPTACDLLYALAHTKGEVDRLLAERAECIEVLHEAAAECDYFAKSYDHAEKTRDTIRALLSRLDRIGGGK